jgi:Na+/melibiose symporter-like transporter
VAFLVAGSGAAGYLVAALAFGAWGMGYNISSVSYLSLAAELSGEKERGKTIAAMWFMMIVAIIITAIGVGQMLDPYSPDISSAHSGPWTGGPVAGAVGSSAPPRQRRRAPQLRKTRACGKCSP